MQVPGGGEPLITLCTSDHPRAGTNRSRGSQLKTNYLFPGYEPNPSTTDNSLNQSHKAPAVPVYTHTGLSYFLFTASHNNGTHASSSLPSHPVFFVSSSSQQAPLPWTEFLCNLTTTTTSLQSKQKHASRESLELLLTMNIHGGSAQGPLGMRRIRSNW